MNTNALARLYDRLTPWERLPLILCYRVPDHFGLAQAFGEVSHRHFMELLDLTALYYQGMWLAESKDTQQAARLLDTAMLLGYLPKVKLAGWRLFCAELRVDPEQFWSCLPGFGTVKNAEDLAERAAFTAEGAEAYLRRKGWEGAGVPTAEGIATALRAVLNARADWWG